MAVTVATEAIKIDPEVVLLDIENFTYIHQGAPPHWYAKLLGRQVYPGRFEQYLKGLGVEYHRLPRPATSTCDSQLPEEVSSELDDAVQSDLFTYLRTDHLEDYPWLSSFTGRRLREVSSPLFPSLVEYLQTNNVTTVYIPNGRVTHQRLSIMAAGAAKCAIRFYEIGRALPNSAYIGDCQIHDRESTQREAKEVAKTLPESKKRQIAREWLAQRMMPGSLLNQYSKTWANPAAKKNQSGFHGQQAVFFTSSADEFSSYGKKWASQSWNHQYEAFAAVLSVLTPRGVSCTLRVHPNLANKGQKYFKRELAHVTFLKKQFPSIRVIWHTDPVSSYDLVQSGDYIFVGRSTLGLEASLLGKAVWTTTPSRYDEVADIRKLLSPASISDSYLDLWEVDTRGSEDFVSYWASQDYPFVVDESEWSDWDYREATLFLRMGNLLLKNSLIHNLHVTRCELRVVVRKTNLSALFSCAHTGREERF